MSHDSAAEIRELKQQVNQLKNLVFGLSGALVYVLGLIPFLVIGFLLSLPILAFTHRFIPGIARTCGRVCSWLMATAKTFMASDHSLA